MKVMHKNNITQQKKAISRQITGRRKNILFTSAIILFISAVILPASLTASTFAESYQTTEDVTFTFNPTVNITVSGDLVINGLSPSNSSDSNQITVTAASNSVAGYTLGSTVGSSSADYTDLRISSSNTSNVFSNLTTNKASLANFSDSNWGYSYSTDSGSTWKSGDITGTPLSGYNGLPKYDGTAVKLINASAPGSSSVKFKIGAKAASTQAAGTYTNTINFIGVSKVVTTAYTINYNDPSGEATNMPATQTGSTTTGAVQLSSTVPYRADYTFKGWCTASTTDATCSGTTVQPGGFLALNTTSASITKPLYAMWDGAPAILWFQDATSANCGEVMHDNRGDDSYKDIEYTTASINGLCWMTRNLDLPGGTTLTSSDTNLTTGFTLPASSTSGFNDYDTDYVYNSGSTTCGSSQPCYSYYSFYTATAHWGTTSVSSGSSSVDICPKGWRLPTQAEYNTLIGTYTTGSTLTASPWLGVYSGHYDYGLFDDGGSYGYYWSSTVYDSYYAYNLDFRSSDAYVDNYNKYYGFAIRCVAKT